MSRSYKKTPCCKDSPDRFNKKRSNRLIRRNNKDWDSPLYRRYYKFFINPWEICDYVEIEGSLHQYLSKYEQQCIDVSYPSSYPSYGRYFPKDRKEAKNWYYAIYKRK